jgi:hypothetical protein
LRRVDQHQVRTHREDPFRIGVQERPYARQLQHLRRIIVIAADSDHLRTCVDCEEDFRQGRNEGDDPPRGRLGLDWLCGDHHQPQKHDEPRRREDPPRRHEDPL